MEHSLPHLLYMKLLHLLKRIFHWQASLTQPQGNYTVYDTGAKKKDAQKNAYEWYLRNTANHRKNSVPTIYR